eukprot:1161865-Pelagomonas_calceolata.AAC.3
MAPKRYLKLWASVACLELDAICAQPFRAHTLPRTWCQAPYGPHAVPSISWALPKHSMGLAKALHGPQAPIAPHATCPTSSPK